MTWNTIRIAAIINAGVQINQLTTVNFSGIPFYASKETVRLSNPTKQNQNLRLNSLEQNQENSFLFLHFRSPFIHVSILAIINQVRNQGIALPSHFDSKWLTNLIRNLWDLDGKLTSFVSSFKFERTLLYHSHSYLWQTKSLSYN